MFFIKQFKKISSIVLSTMMCTATTFASVSIVGYKSVSIPSYNKNHLQFIASPQPDGFKNIQLMKVAFSTDSISYLHAHPQQLLQTEHPHIYVIAMFLGMGDVPVFDQGPWGTPVTFANTAAIDAISVINEDYISQLCLLELGLYFENPPPPQEPEVSGWDGAWANIILSRIKTYGIIAKAGEKKGCGGLTSYPASPNNWNRGYGMSDSEYKNHSYYYSNLMQNVSWNELLNPANAFTDQDHPDEILQNVKDALSHGQRVTVGFLTDVAQGNHTHPISMLGILGKYNQKSTDYDTWIMTDGIKSDFDADIANKTNADWEQRLYGHELIITGFDDTASIYAPYTDASGKHHDYQYGILTLRNSWGTDNGYNGDYYMTDLYFTTLVMEAYEIVEQTQ